MARIGRVVIPDLPHHITQRGVRRMDVFFTDEDRLQYLKHLSEQGTRFGVSHLAWCLMPNHVHLIAIPEREDSLALGISEAHRRYTRYINFREGWGGYMFQGRFHSFPLEGDYLLAAVRYVLRNPVRAGIVRKAQDYGWSNAAWFVGKSSEDPLAVSSDLLTDIDDPRAFLSQEEELAPDFRRHARTGRPLGSKAFIDRLEQLTGRTLRPRKRGPKPSR